MVNPFNEPNIDILKEAFPLIDVSIIDDMLWSAKGDVNQAFELLLAMSDPSQAASNGPPLPRRPNNNSYTGFSTSSPDVTTKTTATTTNTNPMTYTNGSSNAKPSSVREELARWRQDLREESIQRANNARNNNASTSNLSFSNMFKSNSSGSSLHDRNHEQHRGGRGCNRGNRENHRGNFSRHAASSHSEARPSFQRPLIPPLNTTGSVSNMHYSSSTPNVNYTSHGRSNSNPITQLPSTSFRPQLPSHCTPPALPTRHQSSNSLNSNISSTNPFLNSVNNTPPTRRPVPIPATNPHHRETAENDTPSFNPFEEPELPPPAYSEIQRDPVVNLAP